MAYKIERAKKEIIDTLELTSSDGQIKAVIEVSISLPRIAGKYRTAVLAVQQAKQAATDMQAAGDDSDPAQALETLGQAVAAVYELLFGAENTRELLAFFEQNYDELLEQTAPFLTNVVEPAIQEYIAECRRKVVREHKSAKNY